MSHWESLLSDRFRGKVEFCRGLIAVFCFVSRQALVVEERQAKLGSAQRGRCVIKRRKMSFA
jgi:hypothetical protein